MPNTFDRPRGIRLSRVSVIVVSACLIVAVVATGWLYFWDGATESRVLAPSDKVTIGGRVTFTVPAGWEGFYDRYADVPSWVPLGAARSDVPFRERLTLRRVTSRDAPEDSLLADTYYGGHVPPGLSGLPRVASGSDMELYSSERTMIGVVPGDHSIYLTGGSQGDAVASLKRLWNVLGGVGVELP